MTGAPAATAVFEVAVSFLLMITAMTIFSNAVRRAWGEDMAIAAICASTVLILGSILVYLFIWGADAQLVALTRVDRDVYVEAEGEQVPALKRVGGSVYVRVHGARVAFLTDDERETLIRFNGMRPLAGSASSAEASF